MTIEERIKYLGEWVEYLKSQKPIDLSPTQKADLFILQDTIKDLKKLNEINKILETR